MLRIMENWKKGTLCLDCLILEFEEERKLVVLTKTKKFYKETKLELN
jgi:hypothetical protein